MQTQRFSHFILTLLLIASFVLRAWSPSSMAVEHFDEGVYASNFFSGHIQFSYPDRQLYAPPFFPAMLEWVLIIARANPHAVMWVNVVLGTLLVAAVYWTARELFLSTSTDRSSPAVEPQNGKSSPGHITLVSRRAEGAAIASAAIVAFSDQFVEYSRAALTDIPVSLWMTLAVGSGARAFRLQSWWWVCLSGVLTAMAWWTKYNGWLPLAILAAGLAGWFVLTPAGRSSFSRPLPAKEVKAGRSAKSKKQTATPSPPMSAGMRLLLQWGMIAAIAVLLWLPYLNELQAQGGYARVAANHQGYIVGLSGWLASATRHLQVDHFYARWTSATGVLIALILSWLNTDRTGSHTPQRRFTGRRLFRVGLMLLLPACTLLLGLIPTLATGAALSLLLAWRRSASHSTTENGKHELKSEGSRPLFRPSLSHIPLGSWILIAWIAGLTLSTPMYRPYPRLILPWLIGMSIAAGFGLQAAFSLHAAATMPEPKQANSGKARRPREWYVGLATCALILGVPWGLVRTHPTYSNDRTGMKVGAEGLVSAIQLDLLRHESPSLPDLDCVIYVIGEPGLYYQLAALPEDRVKFIAQPASDLGMLSSGKMDTRVATYLITGPHAKKEVEQLRERTQQVRLISMFPGVREEAGFPYFPSDLVLLDDFSPVELPLRRQEEFQLWGVTNSNSSSR